MIYSITYTVYEVVEADTEEEAYNASIDGDLFIKKLMIMLLGRCNL